MQKKEVNMKSVFSAGRLFGLAAAALAASVALVGGSPEARADKLLDQLAGNWKCQSGGCWVRPVGGVKERVGCRVNYAVSGSNMSQSINCKGSIQLTANSKMAKSGERVSGSWSSYNNHTGRISGSASGVATGNRISVGITANDGKTGAMRANIDGNNRHTVTLYQNEGGKRHVVGILTLSR